MKLSFSTVGCTNYTWKDIYSMAKDVGFQGIEVRPFGDEATFGNTQPFRADNLANTMQELKARRLEIPCISVGYMLKVRNDGIKNQLGIRRYIELASKIGTPYIRLLGDKHDDAHYNLDDDVDDDVIYELISTLIPYAEEKGVTLLIESTGCYADTTRLRELLDRFESDNVAALWDIHHPYRYFGESPQQTVQNLGAYIKFTHIKDSVVLNGAVEYRMIGEGDLPMEEILMALKSIKYDGYISLEFLRHHIPKVMDPGIVFPYFVNYMAAYLNQNDNVGRLYNNKRNTGKYIWEKEHLIDLTFPQVLDRMVEEFPDQCAFKYVTHDYTRTYEEFRDDVDRFARALIALGVKTGDHVAIWATNVPQWFITFWATTKIGAVLVTVNTSYKIHEAEYLLRQSDTHTLIMVDGYRDSNYAEIIQTLCPELAVRDKHKALFARRLPFLRNIITVDTEIPGCLTWDEAVAAHVRVPIEDVYRRAAAAGKHDVCNMQYTSGTTGFPKGVMLTHYNIVNNGKAIGDCMDLSTADRMLIQVPMFHCFGMVLSMTACMTHGSTLVPVPAFSPSLGLKCINDEKITAVNGVPTMFIAMLNDPNFESTDFSSMRTGIMAGSPCPIKVMQDVVDKMNCPEICITYGQTEASPGCTMSSTEDSIEVRVNTVGGEIFGVDCKIVDPETGKELPPNTDGELLARGYNIMKGYYKMPEATSAAIDGEGWLHTGDLARCDEDGNFKITGRIKDMIIRGGENIYPKEIEDFIYTHPKVADVQVVGVPDIRYGEEILASVILKEGESMTEDELRDFVKASMARHKTPRYVLFVDSFPMNAAGKIMKYVMREDAVRVLNLQNANDVRTA